MTQFTPKQEVWCRTLNRVVTIIEKVGDYSYRVRTDTGDIYEIPAWHLEPLDDNDSATIDY